MDAILIPADEKYKTAIIQFLNSLKINFETITNVEDSVYNKEFQKMMDESIQQADGGKLKKVSLDEIWK